MTKNVVRPTDKEIIDPVTGRTKLTWDDFFADLEKNPVAITQLTGTPSTAQLRNKINEIINILYNAQLGKPS